MGYPHGFDASTSSTPNIFSGSETTKIAYN